MSLLEAAKAVFVALHRTVPHPWEASLVEASRALSAALASAESAPAEARAEEIRSLMYDQFDGDGRNIADEIAEDIAALVTERAAAAGEAARAEERERIAAVVRYAGEQLGEPAGSRVNDWLLHILDAIRARGQSEAPAPASGLPPDLEAALRDPRVHLDADDEVMERLIARDIAGEDALFPSDKFAYRPTGNDSDTPSAAPATPASPYYVTCPGCLERWVMYPAMEWSVARLPTFPCPRCKADVSTAAPAPATPAARPGGGGDADEEWIYSILRAHAGWTPPKPGEKRGEDTWALRGAERPDECQPQPADHAARAIADHLTPRPDPLPQAGCTCLACEQLRDYQRRGVASAFRRRDAREALVAELRQAVECLSAELRAFKRRGEVAIPNDVMRYVDDVDTALAALAKERA